MSGCEEFNTLRVINSFKSVCKQHRVESIINLQAIYRYPYPEHKLAKFENFGFLLFTTRYLGDQIKKDDVDGPCDTHRRYQNVTFW
jgi:hypothetical protein